jgi:hypothetical protein
MKIQLLKGSFDSKDVEKIITDLLQVKIKYHEGKIGIDDEEETIKMRENRIIKLQNELTELRKYISGKANTSLILESEISIS